MAELVEASAALLERAGNKCELCGGAEGLKAHAVLPLRDGGDDDAVVVCGLCGPQLTSAAELDPKHWYCLQESAWSQVPAVQVVAWRLLGEVGEAWALELKDQLYLEDATLTWAKAAESGGEAASASGVAVVDSNGTALSDGDSVTLIKDLVVKGANFTAKRGTLVKNIRLTDDPE